MKNEFKISGGTDKKALDARFQSLACELGIEAAQRSLVSTLVYAISANRVGILGGLLDAESLSKERIGDASVYVRAMCMLHDRRVSDALKFIANEPDSNWVRLARAEALIAKKEIHAAMTAIESIDPDPEDTPFAIRLAEVAARTYLAMGDYNKARVLLDDACGKWPKDAVLRWMRGNFARSVGKHVLAAENYLEAIERDAKLTAAYSALTAVLPHAPEVAIRATEVLEQVRSNSQNPIVLATLQRALETSGRVDEAIRLNLGGAVELTPQPRVAPASVVKKQPRLDFLIVGAKKCGTTSLLRWIGEHPKASLPHTKEIGFFTHRFSNGLDWYLSHFPPEADTDQCFTGEASPGYFGKTATSSQRIRESLEFVRIIMLLRNPVDRTISDYYQRKKAGMRVRNSMSEAIDGWLNKVDTDADGLDSQNPVLISTYAPRVRRWIETFGTKQCLVLNADEMFAHPSTEMVKVWRFLGVDPAAIEYPGRNRGVYSTDQEYHLTRQRLMEYFRPSIIDLEALLGASTGWLDEQS